MLKHILEPAFPHLKPWNLRCGSALSLALIYATRFVPSQSASTRAFASHSRHCSFLLCRATPRFVQIFPRPKGLLPFSFSPPAPVIALFSHPQPVHRHCHLHRLFVIHASLRSLPWLIELLIELTMAPSSVASNDSADDDGFIVDIDAIQAHGIGAVDIAKLKANGYYTIASVHAATRRTLLKIKGFSEIKVDKVKDAIAKCQPASGGFQTAHELGQQRKRVLKISTGSKQFDAVLGG
ncbi:hypothetical protein BCR34DRAFT_299556 [Clohesyomyces aquaticus]|uniref:Uncharacterized protein n=1 Tax=Clohesyomyces aquaticus TaxID=1231657 RepID=A0A1Y1ZQ69_9PLEO|nr:hypothetical protein BCR34DRAFT_299556 [Clohesyomyces aquaticus]